LNNPSQTNFNTSKAMLNRYNGSITGPHISNQDLSAEKPFETHIYINNGGGMGSAQGGGRQDSKTNGTVIKK